MTSSRVSRYMVVVMLLHNFHFFPAANSTFGDAFRQAEGVEG